MNADKIDPQDSKKPKKFVFKRSVGLNPLATKASKSFGFSPAPATNFSKKILAKPQPLAVSPLLGGGFAARSQVPASTPIEKDVDFEAFRQQKLARKQSEQNLASSTGQKAQSERYTLIPDMPGGGSKYQDHKLGSGIVNRPKDPKCGSGSRYQDHRLSTGATPMRDSQSSKAEKYQDHRLGKGINTSLPRTTGIAEKYQDHRIGTGLNGTKPPAQGERYQDHRQGGLSAITKKNKFTFRK